MILGNPSPKPANLAEWLEQATGDLVPSAQARIRPEIEAHYADAVQAHLANGADEPTAHAAALTDLGNAPAAARRFRREHLTDEDARRMAHWSNPAQVFIARGQCFHAYIICVIYLGSPRDLPTADDRLFLLCHLVALALLLMGIAIAIAAYALPWRTTNLRTKRQIVGLMLLHWINLGAFPLVLFVSLPFWHSPPEEHVFRIFLPVIALNLLLLAIWGSHECLRLRQKLKSANEDDLPPHTPAAQNSFRPEAT
jgi:hypothetical protein